MKKQWISTLLLLVLLCLSPLSLATGQPVIDEAGLFSAEAIASLEASIASFQKETGMDFAILTSNRAHSGTTGQVADEYYDRGGYGLGSEKSGALLYIDMYAREFYLSTGGAMIDYLTDERVESVLDAGYNAMRMGDYASAAQSMLRTVRQYVARGIPEGQYRYDVVTGQRITARHKALTPMEVLVCALVGLVAMLMYTKSVEGSYLVKGSTYEYSYRENSSVNLTAHQDDFLRTTTTRTRKAEPPSGGVGGGASHASPGRSSVHHSSSGVSHGGGGRKF